jgi:hypothetical protein
MTLSSLPIELWHLIFTYIDLKDLSSIMCTNKFFKKIIQNERYNIIDSFNCGNKRVCIPQNIETYEAYKYCIDMTTIIFNKHKLSDIAIDNLNELVDFNLLCTSQQLSDIILYKYYNRIQLKNLICYQKLPLDLFKFVLESSSNIFESNDWYHMCKIQPFTIEIIKKYYHNINWHSLSLNKEILTFDIISNYSDKLVWQDLTALGLCEEIILLNIDKICSICWSNISMCSRLSIEFIRKYFNYLNAMALFTCQTLDELFIEEIIELSFIDEQEFLWNKAASCQSLSKDFILRHVAKLPIHLLIRNCKIKRAVLKEVFG